ncbi:MAG: hypothetical protein WCJ56_06450 [bacterium]
MRSPQATGDGSGVEQHRRPRVCRRVGEPGLLETWWGSLSPEMAAAVVAEKMALF